MNAPNSATPCREDEIRHLVVEQDSVDDKRKACSEALVTLRSIPCLVSIFPSSKAYFGVRDVCHSDREAMNNVKLTVALLSMNVQLSGLHKH